MKQRLSSNAGQATFLAARAEILAGEGQTDSRWDWALPVPLTLTTGTTHDNPAQYYSGFGLYITRIRHRVSR